MAVGLAVLGGSMLLGAGMNYLASRRQAQAAERASKEAAAAGRQASGIIGAAESGAADFLRQGAEQGQQYLGQAGELLSSGSTDFGARFQPEVEAGQGALSRLQSALLGGDASAVAMDPGYQFRLQQGEQALQRAAAASGTLGSGAYLKDTARFSQGLASQEYGNALNRLFALQGIGSQANRAQTGLQASLLGQQVGMLGQQSALASGLGSNLAGLRTNTAANQANALTGSQAQATQYDLAGAQAQARGIAGLGNTLQQLGILGALYGTQPSTNVSQNLASGRSLGYQAPSLGMVGG